MENVKLSAQATEKETDEIEPEPIENQIVVYKEAQDQYALKTAGEKTFVDSRILESYFKRCPMEKNTFNLLKEEKVLFLDSRIHIKKMNI